MKYYLTWLHHNAKGKLGFPPPDGSKKQPDVFLSSHQRAYGLIYLPEGGAINEKLNTPNQFGPRDRLANRVLSTVASIRLMRKTRSGSCERRDI
ncbi:hypothetical protein AVEN_111001-1 [Araneus ventricosus]|uniref:Uncharacterized protein n=1 Tax=Araneus ventricosus TaxID=182803 RepID=A0A4Y2HPG6_ARAVE|nr:hypothetical protein AVEN_111001-1 [Araneus ventricosus]